MSLDVISSAFRCAQKKKARRKEHLAMDDTDDDTVHTTQKPAKHAVTAPLETIGDNSTVTSGSRLTLPEPAQQELRVCHAPVWTSSFHNRRFDSQYLKQSFPAGFRLNSLRAELSHEPSSRLMRRTAQCRAQSPKSSFVDWMKGPSESHDWTADNDQDDPFADCAGPSFAEMQRARRLNATAPVDSVPNDPSCLVRKATIGFQAAKRSHGDLAKPRIYHAPSVLPTLRGTGSSFVQHQQQSEAYEQWMTSRQRKADEIAWRRKGNDVDFNYSSHVFRPEDVISEQPSMFKSSSLSALPTILTTDPSVYTQPWKDTLGLEIYTIKQIMSVENSLENDVQFFFKLVPSTITLQGIVLGIAQDIIDGIKRVFPDLPSLLNSPDYNPVPLNVEAIDMVLTFYHAGFQCWRPLSSESDWVSCKSIVSQSELNIKIMYTLELHSEQLLINLIQSNHRLQQELMAKKRPPVSIQDLTDALNREANRTARKSASAPSLQPLAKRGSSSMTASSLSRSSTKPVALMSTSQSVIYPKSSLNLQKLQAHADAQTQRFEAFASNLDSRILRTKF